VASTIDSDAVNARSEPRAVAHELQQDFIRRHAVAEDLANCRFRGLGDRGRFDWSAVAAAALTARFASGEVAWLGIDRRLLELNNAVAARLRRARSTEDEESVERRGANGFARCPRKLAGERSPFHRRGIDRRRREEVRVGLPRGHRTDAVADLLEFEGKRLKRSENG